ncbi:MAG: hypothetical protein MJ248_01225 [Bacilli bacterium]|nr:hypothetical protein [Bacilli bacterium]
MSNKAGNKKLYLSKGKIIISFVIAFVSLELLFYLTIQFSETGAWFPFGTSFYIYTPLLVILSIIFGILSVTKVYYEVDKNCIVHHKMNKEIEYSFKNITYIDEEWSRKNKQLRFFDKNGKDHYLVFDKEGIIFDMALKYASPLSRDDFRRRFPKAKL